MPRTKKSERKTFRIPVTERAALQRINRKLKGDYRQVRKTRTARDRGNLGEYFLLDTYRNFVVDTYVDLETMAKSLGVMGEWETVIEEDGA